MGKPERKVREKIGSSSSYLLRCFGISRKIQSDKQIADAGQEKKKMKKIRSRWFSLPTKFRLKNGEVTPAPMYETESKNSSVEDDKQNLFRVIRYVTDQKNNTAAVEHKTKEKNTNEQRDIHPDPLSYLGYDTCDVQVSTVRGGKLDRTKTDESNPKEVSREKKSSRVRRDTRVDPVIGISVILVTLMIMLMWGRLFAILCTSAWCYFFPRLKEVATAAAKRKSTGGGKAESGSFPGDLDMYSEAYKKKVVLEGFLHRQHRVSL